MLLRNYRGAAIKIFHVRLSRFVDPRCTDLTSKNVVLLVTENKTLYQVKRQICRLYRQWD